jgi:trypsin
MHPNFDSWMLDYDFALLELASNIEFDYIKKAPIALIGSNEEVAESIPAYVSGWGETLKSNESSEYLRAVIVNIVKFEICEEIYQNHGGVTDRMLCAAGKNKDSCQG